MSEQVEKPMHLRARMDRGGAKVLGPLTILVGVAFITKLEMYNIIGGLWLIYIGLLTTPATRVRASRGHLGFTKWRAYATRLIWFFGGFIGLVIAYPW